MISRKWRDIRNRGEITVASEYFCPVKIGEIFQVKVIEDNGKSSQYSCPVVGIDYDQFTLRINYGTSRL